MIDLDELRAELDEFAQPQKKSARSPKEERVIAGFEEIQRFVDQHSRAPQHGEDKDIFERIYAVRLDRLRSLEECKSLLLPLDHQGLLSGTFVDIDPASISDDELLAELADIGEESNITKLRHVRSAAEIRVAEEIAVRDLCQDFEKYEPLIKQAERELKAGIRQARPFGRDASIELGNFFILSGQFVYVAEVGETIKAPNGESDARLRVIYSNGTESNILRRSLQRALYKDSTGQKGRRLTDPDAGPLFSGNWEDDDIESGTIYVLRSLSNHPFVVEHRELIHKIGVTGGKVEERLYNAVNDATYLLADVEIVATYKLSSINRQKLEMLFHKIFASALLDLTINDRFGKPVKPREWFLVPLHVIDEAVEKIKDGSIVDLVYDPKEARLV